MDNNQRSTLELFIVVSYLEVFKFRDNWISLFLILVLSVGLNSGCVSAAGNSTTAQTSTNFIVGYYINPNVTPISEINFKDLKSAGITDIYVLVTNNNYLSVLPEAKEKADAVGIRTNAWVFPGFNHASQVAQMKIGVQLDMETYNIPAHLLQILAMRLATYGVTFSVTVKPEGWDGNQYYYLIAPLCDYIVPQLYVGDYKYGTTRLKNTAKKYNQIYNLYSILFPGKIVAGLETYQSDENVTPKNTSTLSAEIKAVKPYTRGVILFRYGLSNFNGLE